MTNLEETGATASDNPKMSRPEATSPGSDARAAEQHQQQQAPPSASPPASTPSTTEAPAPASTPAANARRPYQPQFTAMTETILQKIKSGNANLSSAVAGAQAAGMVQLSRAKYEDARRRLVETLKTSDNIELPAVPTRRIKGAPSKPSSASSTPTQGPLKRKRGHLDAAQEHGYPFPDLDIDAPQFKKMAPKAPVRKKKAKDDGTKRCSRCDRQAWTEGNVFITCPRCDENWHLLCNPPEVVKAYRADRAKFRCFGCLEEARQMAEYQKAKSEFAQLKRQHEIARTKERVLASLPIGVSFDKPEMIGFGAGGASDATRAEYFSSMPRRDLLNLLAFCDKLRPSLLVDLLVTATKKHPELPIFNSPDWAAQVAATSSRPRGLSIDPGPEMRTKQDSPASFPVPGSSVSTPKLAAAMKQAAPPKQTQTIDATDAWDDDDDFLPPSWPKEGEGVYATLPPESEDAEHLVDEDEDGAFQGFMVKTEQNGAVRLEPTVCC
ncbi:hypothetical protein jhhlp_007182 [Lomentospora prolificans]|uniref:PHD-type domain-containing protein n=1 Tax=Lomentospora prolificans TaxID=41688 RepID=A0A2N3N1X3_9PEZI|nr:hypothetical protein jhhlp_007182 [Lomentospora prolificans]